MPQKNEVVIQKQKEVPILITRISYTKSKSKPKTLPKPNLKKEKPKTLPKPKILPQSRAIPITYEDSELGSEV